MTGNSTSQQVMKFQTLQEDKTYTVVSIKPINGKYGKTYILSLKQSDDDSIFMVYSTKSIVTYINKNSLETNPEKFDFTVRKITSGKYEGQLYAEIDGHNNGGFIELK
jgi:hypothetical protein